MLFLLAACVTEPPEYAYGIDLNALEFVLHDLDMGVYPNNSLGTDPNNPFGDGIASSEKWALFDAGTVPGFYAFGTVLLYEPTGENQLYTATAAHELYLTGQADDHDLWAVREIAVAGYQSVLDNFPNDVTYDASGTVAWEVAPIAQDGLDALGGGE